MQPPPRAPDWVIDWVRNTPDNWTGCALRKDQQAAGLLPSPPLGGQILTGGCAREEAAYQHWKQAVDELWEDERHHLQTAACQCHLDEKTARQCQEANCCQ